LAQDWSNPFVRNHIQVYPDVSTSVSESWQAGKWLEELDLDDLSPMWANWDKCPHRQYFIKELAQIADESFVIPSRWIMSGGVVYAECYKVVYCKNVSSLCTPPFIPTSYRNSKTDTFSIHDHDIRHIEASKLKCNILDLQCSSNIKFVGQHFCIIL
jgi:hypothetical protein